MLTSTCTHTLSRAAAPVCIWQEAAEAVDRQRGQAPLDPLLAHLAAHDSEEVTRAGGKGVDAGRLGVRMGSA